MERAILQKETAPVEARRFSDEAREALIKDGYVIINLTGKSIRRSHRERGFKFWSNWHKYIKVGSFETKGSMTSEVAIKPDAPFIPGSNNKTLKEQKDMIAEFSRDLGKKIKGVKAIMGEAPDYVELAFTHLDAIGGRLHGEEYGYNFARTKTPAVGFHVAVVGYFNNILGIGVTTWHRNEGQSRIYAAPIVVPAKSSLTRLAKVAA